MKYIFTLFIIAIIFLLTSVNVLAVKPVYKLGYDSQWVGWWFIPIGKELGYYKNIEPVPFNSCYDNMSAFKNGKVDFMIDMVGTIYSDEDPSTILLFITDMSAGGDVLLKRKGKKLDKDNTIHVYTDNIALTYFMEEYFRSFGFKYIQPYVQFEPEYLVNLFITGKIDFLLIYEPYTSMVLSTGEAEVVTSSAKYPIPEGIAYNRNSGISVDAQVELIESTIKSLKFMNNKSNRKKLIKIIRSLKLVDGETDEEIDKMLDNIIYFNEKEFILYNTDYINDYTIKIEEYYNKTFNTQLNFLNKFDNSAIKRYFNRYIN